MGERETGASEDELPASFSILRSIFLRTICEPHPFLEAVLSVCKWGVGSGHMRCLLGSWIPEGAVGAMVNGEPGAHVSVLYLHISDSG